MLLWMILVTWQIAGAIDMTPEAWLIVTVACWGWNAASERK